MTKKTSKARREAFFKALAETGNQTISAERARVSRSWVTLHRSADPDFKARMEAAISDARARLSGTVSQAPDAAWGDIDGEQLVVRGSGGAGGGRLVQVARARLGQWTPGVERRFLRTLAATCNVKVACAEVSMTAAAAVHRSKWPSFARRWDEAIDIGYTRLEFMMIDNASCMLEQAPVDPDAPIPPMTVDQALQVLHMHKHEQRGIGKAPGLQRRPVDVEAVKVEIVRKAKAIDRHIALEAGPLPDFMRDAD